MVAGRATSPRSGTAAGRVSDADSGMADAGNMADTAAGILAGKASGVDSGKVHSIRYMEPVLEQIKHQTFYEVNVGFNQVHTPVRDRAIDQVCDQVISYVRWQVVAQICIQIDTTT